MRPPPRREDACARESAGAERAFQNRAGGRAAAVCRARHGGGRRGGRGGRPVRQGRRIFQRLRRRAFFAVRLVSARRRGADRVHAPPLGARRHRDGGGLPRQPRRNARLCAAQRPVSVRGDVGRPSVLRQRRARGRRDADRRGRGRRHRPLPAPARRAQKPHRRGHGRGLFGPVRHARLRPAVRAGSDRRGQHPPARARRGGVRLVRRLFYGRPVRAEPFHGGDRLFRLQPFPAVAAVRARRAVRAGGAAVLPHPQICAVFLRPPGRQRLRAGADRGAAAVLPAVPVRRAVRGAGDQPGGAGRFGRPGVRAGLAGQDRLYGRHAVRRFFWAEK